MRAAQSARHPEFFETESVMTTVAAASVGVPDQVDTNMKVRTHVHHVEVLADGTEVPFDPRNPLARAAWPALPGAHPTPQRRVDTATNAGGNGHASADAHAHAPAPSGNGGLIAFFVIMFCIIVAIIAAGLLWTEGGQDLLARMRGTPATAYGSSASPSPVPIARGRYETEVVAPRLITVAPAPAQPRLPTAAEIRQMVPHQTTRTFAPCDGPYWQDQVTGMCHRY